MILDVYSYRNALFSSLRNDVQRNCINRSEKRQWQSFWEHRWNNWNAFDILRWSAKHFAESEKWISLYLWLSDPSNSSHNRRMSWYVSFCYWTCSRQSSKHFSFSCKKKFSLKALRVNLIRWNYFFKDVTLPTPVTGASQANQHQIPQRPAHAIEYNFLDIELKYGLLQVNVFVRSSLIKLENKRAALSRVRPLRAVAMKLWLLYNL